VAVDVLLVDKDGEDSFNYHVEGTGAVDNSKEPSKLRPATLQ
jgi:hypothetical protein